jgi:hypothetical protein
MPVRKFSLAGMGWEGLQKLQYICRYWTGVPQWQGVHPLGAGLPRPIDWQGMA